MPNFRSEQTFIVTGASSGLGEATALLLNEKGASVVAIARNRGRLGKLKEKCKYPENIHLEIKDLTEDIGNLPQYVKELKNKYGKFSGLAYCAGVACVLPHQMFEFSKLQEVFKINYFAPIMLTKGITDRRNNIGNGCSLVYISSIDAIANTKGQAAYGASKAALTASIKTISREVAGYGVRVNCVLPSMIKTPMTTKNDLENYGITDKNQAQMYPFGWGEPDDVSNLIVYLLSDKAKFISGQNYIIDSGGVL